MNENEAKWLSKIKKELIGATIIGVRYMEVAEIETVGWYSRAVVLILQNKKGEQFAVYPSADDEGNDAGALFTTLKDLPTIPVFG